MAELLARLRTAARVSGAVTRVEIGNPVIDLDNRLVTRAGTPIRLTPKEYDLSAVFARKAGRVVTHRQILTEVRGPAHHDDTQYPRVFTGQLSAKIEPDPVHPDPH